MHDNDQRRRQAELYRRLASIPTEGGHSADKVLLKLAEKLESEAIEDAETITVAYLKTRHSGKQRLALAPRLRPAEQGDTHGEGEE